MPKKIFIVTAGLLLAVGAIFLARERVWRFGFNGRIDFAPECDFPDRYCAMAPLRTPALAPDSPDSAEVADKTAPEKNALAIEPVTQAANTVLAPDVSEKSAALPVIKLPGPDASAADYMLLDVPFLSQAPFGDWPDPRQQDGCEEAASIMALAWARGAPLDKDEGLREIFALAEYQENAYGSYHDTSAADTASRIISGYYNWPNATVQENITLDDIKAELKQGRLVITPMNGQALQNPNYTAPGPERHMVVVKGYAPDKQEFITNDPGTRKGQGYRYPEGIFYAAIRDYPTGDHQPIEGIKKTMIIVSKP